ncbi:hypothetical protein QBC40DRAFT_70418 [Triangularia verruculosa]|uniref:Secreted protein n=1 Tax=Triangularia verruculosa TaxID=2587418 RepID=A0AAN7AWY5_9PEZI|nr:hypothetical protein QBC40DRAFT_70418 [Triangularia verruculosa]
MDRDTIWIIIVLMTLCARHGCCCALRMGIGARLSESPNPRMDDGKGAFSGWRKYPGRRPQCRAVARAVRWRIGCGDGDCNIREGSACLSRSNKFSAKNPKQSFLKDFNQEDRNVCDWGLKHRDPACQTPGMLHSACRRKLRTTPAMLTP